MLKAALFDLDGVVFDTEPQYTVFWGSQCRLYHPERPGLEHEIKGSTLTQIFDRWFAGPLEQERDIITKRLDDFEAQMTFNYVTGFEAFVKDLRRHNVKTAVVTSSNRAKMESVYRQRPELLDMMDAILTSEDFAHSKPHPDCYERGAARFGLPADECVVFEDSLNGLRSGRSAGCTVVGLSTTLPADVISDLCDVEVADYTGMSYDSLCEAIRQLAAKG